MTGNQLPKVLSLSCNIENAFCRIKAISASLKYYLEVNAYNWHSVLPSFALILENMYVLNYIIECYFWSRKCHLILLLFSWVKSIMINKDNVIYLISWIFWCMKFWTELGIYLSWWTHNASDRW